MFGEPIVVILYCFFIAVSPFFPKDSGQTRNFFATLSKFFHFFGKFQSNSQKLATLACSFVDKEETRRFFFLAESLSDFGLKTFMCANTNRATARVKNIVRTIKIQKISLYFLLFPCRVRQNRIVRFPSKDKKIKGVNNQNEKSNYLCPLFQR